MRDLVVLQLYQIFVGKCLLANVGDQPLNMGRIGGKTGEREQVKLFAYKYRFEKF